MIQISPLWLLLLGEVFFIFLVLTGTIAFVVLRRHAADRRALQRLVGNIKSDTERRQTETRNILAERFAYEGENLDQAVRNIDRSEKLLYQCLINMYLRRDSLVFERLNIEVEGSTEVYRNLDVPKGEKTGQDAGSESQSKIEQLEQENERLSEELRVTMDTISRMLNEYSSMFAGSADSQLDKEKMAEMFRAEEAGEVDRAEMADTTASDANDTMEEEPELIDEVLEMDQMMEVELAEAPETQEPASKSFSEQAVDETMVISDAVSDSTSSDIGASNPAPDTDEIFEDDAVIIELDDEEPVSAKKLGSE